MVGDLDDSHFSRFLARFPDLVVGAAVTAPRLPLPLPLPSSSLPLLASSTQSRRFRCLGASSKEKPHVGAFSKPCRFKSPLPAYLLTLELITVPLISCNSLHALNSLQTVKARYATPISGDLGVGAPRLENPDSKKRVLFERRRLGEKTTYPHPLTADQIRATHLHSLLCLQDSKRPRPPRIASRSVCLPVNR